MVTGVFLTVLFMHRSKIPSVTQIIATLYVKDRSIHKLFSDRMSKNVSVYIHIEFDDFN